MKAIILAGGEGTRLRPLSLRRPKPMLRLFDRPLLEYLVCLLRDNGFTQLCMTLRYLPRQIQDWFGDGDSFGVELEYRIETAPRGTAGSVRDCADFLNGEDFLVISGDAACSLDLRTFWEKHRISGADATILTHACPDPLEYGLVVTDGSGAVRSFLEKPAPGSVCTDLVNTGIYALSNRVLADIPPVGTSDFGTDVFPLLLRQRRRVLTWRADGYWNDVGSCAAYLQTCRDVLDGVFPLPISESSFVSPEGPVWVSPGATVSPEAQLGPYTVIGAGSQLQAGCRVTGSILDGALVENGAEVTGSILASGARVGVCARLERGCVLGDGAVVGEGCILRSGVQMWPDSSAAAHSELSDSVRESADASTLSFSRDGCIHGESSRCLSPKTLYCLGTAELQGSRVAAAASGGNMAQLLAFSFLCGNAAVGRDTLLLDADSPASASLSAANYQFSLTLFVSQQGRQLRLFFLDENGLPISRRIQRRLEAAMHGPAGCISLPCGSIRPLLGAVELERAAIRRLLSSASPIPLSILGNRMLRSTLSELGFQIVPPEMGVPQFQCSEDGFTLSAIDENGRSHSQERLLLAGAAAAFRTGIQEVCVPGDASFLHEELAARYGASVYRLGRDGADAARLYRQQPWCRNASLLCSMLLNHLSTGESTGKLSALMESLPDSYRAERVISSLNELRLLRKASALPECIAADGLEITTERGKVRIERLRPSELRILAESRKAEFASELCAEYGKKLSTMDE